MLLTDVQRICRRLRNRGWGEMLEAHGLHLDKRDLESELLRDNLQIDRSMPGFEDFSGEGMRAVEPGNPARSLLYHAFASPNVQHTAQGSAIDEFPTLPEIEILENYIFSLGRGRDQRRPSLESFRKTFKDLPLGVVVFAYEYRPAARTCHQRHADLCFSRTGVARVGTTTSRYNSLRRGFVPRSDTGLKDIRVVPARYAAFLSILQPGSKEQFCPMRFRNANESDSGRADNKRQFWVPIHKLFSGPECLGDIRDLEVSLTCAHFNEKLRRIHLEFARRHPTQTKPGGWGPPDIDNFPFRITQGIAEFADPEQFGEGMVMPLPHPLVEPAVYKGGALYFSIPKGHPTGDRGWLSSSLAIEARGSSGPEPVGARHAPEYVNVRHRLVDGQEVNLNQESDATFDLLLRDSSVRARHFVDWTGDGWVGCTIPQIKGKKLPFHAAYSLVTAPDFFPNVDQRALMEWSARLPDDLRKSVWPTPPLVLSDQRFAANTQLGGAGFDPKDDTVTAIVSLHMSPTGRQMQMASDHTARHSWLPDDSAGVFEPGWDVSFDSSPAGDHLAAYGLGSPFPEDAKLCAALSSFWPGVAPDSTRTFLPALDTPITVAPMTDEEIGQNGQLPWDGISGPQVIGDEVEYARFERADYVDSAARGDFSLALTAQVDQEGYQNRVLAMAKAYEVITNSIGERVKRTDKKSWLLLSFRSVSAGDAEFLDAQRKGTVTGDIYRFEFIRNTAPAPLEAKPWLVRIRIKERTVLFVGVLSGTVFRVLVKEAGNDWRLVRFQAA